MDDKVRVGLEEAKELISPDKVEQESINIAMLCV
jgi:hypothetical protein